MCWVNKEKERRGGGEENGGGKEGGKRRGRGREEGEGLGLEIVPVIRKILLQAILTARAAGSGGGWWEGKRVGGRQLGGEAVNVEVKGTTAPN